VEQPAKLLGLVAYVMGITSLIAVLLGVLSFLGADSLEPALGMRGISFDLKFLLVLLPTLMILSMALSVLRGFGRSEWRAYIYYYLVGVLFLAAILFSSGGGLTAAEAYWSRIASIGVGAAVALYLVSRSIPAGREFFKREHIWKLHSFGSWLVLVGIFQYAVEQPLLDLVMVGRFDSAVAVGLYSVGAKAAAVTAIGGVALNVVMAPDFSRSLAEGSYTELRDRYRQASKWMALGAVGCGIIVLLFHRQVLLLFGPEYLAAGTILQILAGGQIIAGVLGVNTPILLASGLAKVECALTAAACALLIGSAIGLGQRFGAVGVALATAGTTALLALSRRLAVVQVFRSWRIEAARNGPGGCL